MRKQYLDGFVQLKLIGTWEGVTYIKLVQFNNLKM